ncbi:MAG: S-adenosylmethionine:tRNA ribosyltransferase-isomerase, partial [Methyloceanibacter sp.]
MRTDLFDFHLPEALIALRPANPRDAARLLVVAGDGRDALADKVMTDLPALLQPGDALVLNDTRVILAALKGTRTRGEVSAQVSVTLAERLDDARWQVLARPAKRLDVGDR